MKNFTSTRSTIFSLFVFLSTVWLSFAHESVPFELQELQRKHAERISDADNDHMKSLKKLEAKFAKRGDIEAANQVADILDERKLAESGVADLCQIRVSSETEFSAHQLTNNVRRLSGGYRPSFSFVSEDIKGAQFTRVPWQSKPSYKVEVLTSGYLYFIGIGWNAFEPAEQKIRAVENRLRGSYLGKVYAVYVTAGQTFQCGGYEGCLIACEITSNNSETSEES